MKFKNQIADIHIPDKVSEEEAMSRTTRLSIGCHQDDCEIMSYCGIGACYDKEDEWYTAIVLTDGSGSPRSGEFADYTNEQIGEVRSQEQRDASDVGKYSAIVQLKYTSEEVRTARKQDVEDELVELIKMARPRYIYMHNPADRHETHLGACLRTLAALRRLPEEYRPEKVFGMEVWRSLDWLSDRDRLTFDTSMYPEIAAGVITAFSSQCTPLKRFDEAALGRRLGNATFQAPRDCDPVNSVQIGVDLTELAFNSDIDIKEYTLSLIDRFKEDAGNLIDRFK